MYIDNITVPAVRNFAKEFGMDRKGKNFTKFLNLD